MGMLNYKQKTSNVKNSHEIITGYYHKQQVLFILLLQFSQFGNDTPPKRPFEETIIEGIFFSFFSLPSFVR